MLLVLLVGVAAAAGAALLLLPGEVAVGLLLLLGRGHHAVADVACREAPGRARGRGAAGASCCFVFFWFCQKEEEKSEFFSSLFVSFSLSLTSETKQRSKKEKLQHSPTPPGSMAPGGARGGPQGPRPHETRTCCDPTSAPCIDAIAASADGRAANCTKPHPFPGGILV